MKNIMFSLMLFVGVAGLLILSSGFLAPTDYKFHSVYVYNFTKYIQWPSNNSDIKINIFGNDGTVYKSFQDMADAKSNDGRKILVQQFNSVNALEDCDILFIPYKESSIASKAIEKYQGKGTLIITEREGLINSGSCINFVIVDNRLKFEISKSAIEGAGLKISSQLLQMGIVK
ncbi:MAG: YfiR family protein [Candidatus Cyclobacteriaceae bacterium M3_2C_046]